MTISGFSSTKVTRDLDGLCEGDRGLFELVFMPFGETGDNSLLLGWATDLLTNKTGHSHIWGGIQADVDDLSMIKTQCKTWFSL